MFSVALRATMTVPVAHAIPPISMSDWANFLSEAFFASVFGGSVLLEVVGGLIPRLALRLPIVSGVARMSVTIGTPQSSRTFLPKIPSAAF